MAELSKENLDFILKHDIPLSEVFDATGMRRKDYLQIMEENGFRYAYGVTPCEKSGHTLRYAKNGSCIICNPKSIRYRERFRESGFVYIFISMQTKLVKIGSAKDYNERIVQLNNESYGGVNDWQLLAYSYQQEAGRIENTIQSIVLNSRLQKQYYRGNQPIVANEVFDISLRDLLDKVDTLGYKFEFPNQVLLQSLLNSNEKNKGSEKQIHKIPIVKIQPNQTTSQLSQKERAEIDSQRAKIDELNEEDKRKVEEQASIERLVQEQAKTDAIIKEQKRLEEIEKERLRLTKVIEEKNRSEGKKIALEQQERIDSARKPNEFVENTNISSSRTQQQEIERQKTKNKITMIIFIAIIVAILFLIFTN